MLFLINNPVITFVILLGIGISVVMISKIVNEIKLNNALFMKHKQMRIKHISKPLVKRMSFLSGAALAPAALLVIAFMVGVNIEPNTTGSYISVSSSEDVLSLYRSFNDRLNNDYEFTGIFGLTRTLSDVGIETLSEDASNTNYGTGSDDYSETNNQVSGVDEIDNVLTDGQFIYTLNGNQVQITLAYNNEFGPEVLEVIKTIDYGVDTCSDDYFYPVGMYVDDDQLIVIGNQYSYNCDETKIDDFYYGYMSWYQHSSSIKVLVYDKENNFTLDDEYQLTGYFTGTRKIDDSLYIVTNNYIPFYLEEINVDDYLPYYEVNSQHVDAKYEDIIYVDGTNPNAFTTFYGINLNTTKVEMETILGDSGYNLYVSPENMYLVGTTYYFWPLIDIVALEDPVYEQKTAILKVGIGSSSVDFSGVGYVDGHTLNQFSMDEYDNHLRITTTSGWWGSNEINNRLWILDENLEVVSVLEHLGKPGETIRSTRFVGEYAYLVTFEQTDPFYVIDCSDVENPEVAGELEMPGFSTYLQPLNEDYMLGIGFDADINGRIQGLKISIYNISDKENPTIFDEVTFDYEDFGWSWSSATYNHKDLLLSLEKGLIALPFSTYDYSSVDGYTYNSGILVYNIDLETGLTYSGFVEHETNSENNVYVYKSKFITDTINHIDYFYTISNKYIKVSNLTDVEDILYSVQIGANDVSYDDGTLID